MKRVVVFTLVILAIVGCKSNKVTVPGTAVAMSTKKVIKNHQENHFDAEFMSAKLKAVYDDGKTKQTISVKFRMQTDSAIWMSGTVMGYPVAKLLITPESVQFYEKLDKSYFEGDFELLSNFLGTDVSFNLMQNLLLGHSVKPLKSAKFSAVVDDASYKLSPKEQEALFDVFFWVYPNHFRLKKQQISQPTEQKRLTIEYGDYQKVEEHLIPKDVRITAIEQTDRTLLTLEYRGVELNKKQTFPYKVPQGYKPISFE
ncbi:DUF4292 domain-containing protein [Urechidicola sp. KH5]